MNDSTGKDGVAAEGTSTDTGARTRRPGRGWAWTAATLAALVGAAAAGCHPGEDGPPGTGDDGEVEPPPATVEEVFFTERDTLDDVDSPAVWHGPGDRHWLLATAKSGGAIRVSDASTGRFLQRVGRTGDARGEFDHPNGIAVADDLVFVVERDNRRVQVFRLPGFRSLGWFGTGELRSPYGLWVEGAGEDSYTVWVTDSYTGEDRLVPPDSLLGRRVHEFVVATASDPVSAEHVRAFGDTAGPGRLHLVESIVADPEHGRLLIAEEEPGASEIKVYGLDGRFAGQVIPGRHFPHQAEGIALYGCEEGGGYWIATDQADTTSTFHLFDRRTLEHVGSFRGARVRNADGVALSRRAFGPFPAGAFFAVHDDGSTAAFSWADVESALGLRESCTLSAGGAADAALR